VVKVVKNVVKALPKEEREGCLLRILRALCDSAEGRGAHMTAAMLMRRCAETYAESSSVGYVRWKPEWVQLLGVLCVTEDPAVRVLALETDTVKLLEYVSEPTFKPKKCSGRNCRVQTAQQDEDMPAPSKRQRVEQTGRKRHPSVFIDKWMSSMPVKEDDFNSSSRLDLEKTLEKVQFLMKGKRPCSR